MIAELVVLIGLDALRCWELMFFAVLFGTFDSAFGPAMIALTTKLVPEELLPAMSSVRHWRTNWRAT